MCYSLFRLPSTTVMKTLALKKSVKKKTAKGEVHPNYWTL